MCFYMSEKYTKTSKETGSILGGCVDVVSVIHTLYPPSVCLSVTPNCQHKNERVCIIYLLQCTIPTKITKLDLF